MQIENNLEFGFAKRFNFDDDGLFSFDAVQSLARDFVSGPHITPQQINRAIAFGLSDLRANERLLLSILAARLTIEQIKSGQCFVWMGNSLLGQFLGVGERAVCKIKQALEARGLILRHYDRRNRGATGEHLDLRPFLCRLPELLDRAEAVFDAERERLAAGRCCETADLFEGESRCRVPRTEIHPNSIKITDKVSVRGDAFLNAEDPPDFLEADGAEASPDVPLPRVFWRGCGKAGSVRQQEAVAELKALRVISDDFAGRISEHDIEFGSLNLLLQATAGFVACHYSPERNPLTTLKWGLRRHGWRACILAVLGQVDETVHKPDSYFGALCSRKELDGVELSRDLARVVADCQGTEALLAEQVEQVEAVQTQATVRGLWQAAQQLMMHRDKAHRHWWESMAYQGFVDGVLTLGARSQFIFRVTVGDGEELCHALQEVGLDIAEVRFGTPEGAEQ